MSHASVHLMILAALAVAMVACRQHAPAMQAREIDWRTSPLDLDLRGMIGAHYAFHCAPGKPLPAMLTGSDVYTDASSICTAAVQTGAIDPQRGGDVVIQILRGRPNYQSSTRNFVHSRASSQPWDGSFAVLGSSLK